MALPKLLRKPLKWIYCAVIVVIGFAGRAHLSRWHEDWSESLPPHQVARYVALVENGDAATIEKLLHLAHDEHYSVRNTAIYLLDEGGALDRLDRASRVDYLMRRLTSPAFGIYEREDPHAEESDFDFQNKRDVLNKLWQDRDLANPIVVRITTLPGQFAQVLRDRWTTRWLYIVDRAECTQLLMEHLKVAAAALRSTQNNRQFRRHMELQYAVPLLSWTVAYTPFDPGDSFRRMPTQFVEPAGELAQWWQAHASLTQDQREAEAIEALLSNGPPSGAKLPYAAWLLNRPLEGMDEAGWRRLREQGANWTRLDWATDGFRQSGYAIEAPWDAEDVELLLGILERAANGSGPEAPQGYLVSNALWLLERLAPEPPPPRTTAWIGPLVGFPWAEEEDWKVQSARWNDWWTGTARPEALRDPSESLW
jgi:hypothetical protein